MNKELSYPILLKPVGKDYLWGGNKLNEEFNKGINMSPLAETWECSSHPDGQSIINSGIYCGQTLASFINEFPEVLGSKYAEGKDLPILVKFIDAHSSLSVQVHPDDKYAFEKENGQRGKNECWYVVEADENASLVYGFAEDVTAEYVRKAIEEARIEEKLNITKVHKGDVFYIPAGKIHAIGAGCLIAECQQSSNLTYRLYDYNRKDAKGNLRELHVEKALDVMDLNKVVLNGNKSLLKMSFKNMVVHNIVDSPYFNIDKVELINADMKTGYKLLTGSQSFTTLLCVDGCGSICYEDKEMTVNNGDCIFVPADSCKCVITGSVTVLTITC